MSDHPPFRRIVDSFDDYSPTDHMPAAEIGGEKLVVLADGKGAWGNVATWQRNLKSVMDGYQNRLTGVGDPGRDKTYGGRWNGPEFFNQFLTGWEAQERWRGSDLGGRIVEILPREMTRSGWTISIQPDEADKKKAGRTDGVARRSTRGRLDDLPPAEQTEAAPKVPGAVAISQHVPGELPDESDDNTAILEALAKEQEALGLGAAIYEGICYERNYGGAGILIGVDDGETNLTKPLDWKKVKRITHLTPFRGGWDGEIIGYGYYCDPTERRFGMPRVYQLRNLGVSVDLTAPGEEPRASKNGGALIFYVHESRFLLFPGTTVSHWARVQMRGWGDSIWMRINQILSQYDQSWNGIAILLSELGLPVLSMDGLSRLMSSEDEEGMAVIQARATAMQMAMSIAKTRIIDSKEKLERVKLDLGGVADVLREMALRLSAASDIPASRLLNQGKGGLGDTGKGDQDIFDTEICGRWARQVLPILRKFIALQFACSEGVTGGKMPKRWAVEMNPLRQMTDKENADLRDSISKADEREIDKGVVLPEEVASTRYGGSKYNTGPIVLDLEGRKMLAQKDADQPEPAASPAGPAAPPKPPAAQPGAVPPPAPEATMDAADFVTRNGRTKVQSACSVIAAFNRDGLMLMGVRADSGKLSCPGGHAEPGEDALSTAVRELYEETGLHPKRIALIGSKTIGGTLLRKNVSVYRALVDGEPTNENDPDNEFTSFQWIDMSNGTFPPDVKANLHHAKDVVGPMLRRRK